MAPDGAIPMAEAPSWMTHNSYRLNLPIEPILAAPNLTAVVAPFDDTRCSEGVIGVCATVENRGEVRVGPGLSVAFFDGEPAAGGVPIGATVTTRALEPGGPGEVVCVEWDPAPTETRQVWVRVDDGDAERECIEADNVVELGPAQCVPFG